MHIRTNFEDESRSSEPGLSIEKKDRILTFDDSRVILRSSRKFGLEPPPRSTAVGEGRRLSVGDAVD